MPPGDEDGERPDLTGGERAAAMAAAALARRRHASPPARAASAREASVRVLTHKIEKIQSVCEGLRGELAQDISDERLGRVDTLVSGMLKGLLGVRWEATFARLAFLEAMDDAAKEKRSIGALVARLRDYPRRSADDVARDQETGWPSVDPSQLGPMELDEWVTQLAATDFGTLARMQWARSCPEFAARVTDDDMRRALESMMSDSGTTPSKWAPSSPMQEVLLKAGVKTMADLHDAWKDRPSRVGR